LEVSDAQIQDWLYQLFQLPNSPGKAYFKFAIYGLRSFFRIFGVDNRRILLPPIKVVNKLPLVLSRKECKELFAAPSALKNRIILSFIYSAGLRASEACNLKISDIDSDRMTIFIRQGKGRKDRFVVLSPLILEGLRKYFKIYRPVDWLFYGKKNGERISVRALEYMFREAMEKTSIRKAVSLHSLRHSFATHLLEEGLDLVSIKELLGHSNVETTMVYLHVAQFDQKRAFSPFDSLYRRG